MRNASKGSAWVPTAARPGDSSGSSSAASSSDSAGHGRCGARRASSGRALIRTEQRQLRVSKPGTGRTGGAARHLMSKTPRSQSEGAPSVTAKTPSHSPDRPYGRRRGLVGRGARAAGDGA